MNKKQYRTTLIAFGVLAAVALAADAIWRDNQDLLWIFIGISVAYIYVRYRITSPLQMFSTKFNMLVDYDLDVEEALKMAKAQYENSPTEQVSQLVMIYLGMAYYYNANYREAMNTFNQIKLNKVNQVYHVLIFAFSAYAAYEIDDTEAFNIALSRMEDAKNKINKRYFAFASSYLEILTAMQNLEVNPDNYREVIERNFSREDGYISTRLVYNYRMGRYYKAINNKEEMDKCFATVIANGKNHHTAIRAKELFEGSCNIEDFVFAEPGSEVYEDVETTEEPLQIDQLEEIEVVEETIVDEEHEVIEELAEEMEHAIDETSKELDYSSMSVSELREICKEKNIAGYYKMKKSELVEALEALEK